MRVKKLSLVAGLFLMCSALAAQQAATAPVVTPVTIRVTDPSGAGVPHVPVRVIPAPDAATKMETDAKGQLALDLKPGGYAVFARAAGFKPGVAHIDVAPPRRSRSDSGSNIYDSLTTRSHVFSTSVSRVVERRLGHLCLSLPRASSLFACRSEDYAAHHGDHPQFTHQR